MTKKITFSDVYIIAEQEDKNVRQKLAFHLHAAMNEWPLTKLETDTIDEYLNQVREFINNNIINKVNIQIASDKLNPAKDAWYMESLSGLLLIFDIIKTEEINGEIIEKLLYSK
jgi:hypothetical protein